LGHPNAIQIVNGSTDLNGFASNQFAEEIVDRRSPMNDWTRERIAELPTIKSVKNLQENARKQGNNAVVDLCDADLARRTSRHNRVVVGFHFVCDKDNGVRPSSDGTIWTGTWVVDKVHAKRAKKIGAYVALHETKAEPSYRQGIIKGWSRGRRGPEAKREFGIDFLFEPTNEPREWNGVQSGEKGYLWSSELARPFSDVRGSARAAGTPELETN
jgi:hypothetical protein